MSITDDNYDGWVVVHSDDTDPDDHPGGLGPFPTKELAELVIASMPCSHTKVVLGIDFPPGISMNLSTTARNAADTSKSLFGSGPDRLN